MRTGAAPVSEQPLYRKP